MNTATIIIMIATLLFFVIMILNLGITQRALLNRVQYLEDENRWLRAEVEVLIEVSPGEITRKNCERGEHVIAEFDEGCVYCGTLAGRFTVAPSGFPHAISHRGRR